MGGAASGVAAAGGTFKVRPAAVAGVGVVGTNPAEAVGVGSADACTEGGAEDVSTVKVGAEPEPEPEAGAGEGEAAATEPVATRLTTEPDPARPSSAAAVTCTCSCRAEAGGAASIGVSECSSWYGRCWSALVSSTKPSSPPSSIRGVLNGTPSACAMAVGVRVEEGRAEVVVAVEADGAGAAVTDAEVGRSTAPKGAGELGMVCRGGRGGREAPVAGAGAGAVVGAVLEAGAGTAGAGVAISRRFF